MLAAELRKRLADAIWPEGRERRNVLERNADTDPLTFLPNAGALARALPAAEADPDMLFIAVDLDDYKELNDVYGHTVGDDALRAFSESVRALCLGKNSRPFRWGGDEFVVICPMDRTIEIRDGIEGIRWTHGRWAMRATTGIGGTREDADQALLRKKRQKKSGR